MTERSRNLQSILDITLVLESLSEKEKYIKNIIVPAMDKRRGREISMSKEDVLRKLWSPPSSDKPGEEHEMAQAMIGSNGELLTVYEALEIADLVYYYSQPNTPVEISKDALETFLFIILGEMGLALDFTIIKYEARLRYGDSKEYKQIEKELMEEYFKIKGLPGSLV